METNIERRETEVVDYIYHDRLNRPEEQAKLSKKLNAKLAQGYRVLDVHTGSEATGIYQFYTLIGPAAADAQPEPMALAPRGPETGAAVTGLVLDTSDAGYRRALMEDNLEAAREIGDLRTRDIVAKQWEKWRNFTGGGDAA